MIKKTVTYTDFNGTERTESFYFNLTQAELTQMDFSQAGGLTAKIEGILEAQDNAEILRIFKDIIERSYGIKSDDGKRFIKTEAIIEDFKATEAYSQIFMELMQDEGAAVAFINGVIPTVKPKDHLPAGA